MASKFSGNINVLNAIELRRQAIQIVALLPESRSEAVAVLMHALDLVGYIHDSDASELNVLRMVKPPAPTAGA